MAVKDVSRVRNFALVGHSGAGKTSLAEAILFDAGALTRMGSTEQGNTAMDYAPEETRRQTSIYNAVASVERNGTFLEFVDCPGYTDFIGEVRSALAVVDAALLLVDADAGVGVGTEKAWDIAAEFGVPCAIFVNKVDRDNADPEGVLSDLQELWGRSVVPVQALVGKGAGFKGVADVLSGRFWPAAGDSAVLEPGEPPADAGVSSVREALVEVVAESDEALTDKYLEQMDLSPEDLAAGLRRAIAGRKLVPVLYGAATRNAGVHAALEFIAEYFPSPADLPPRKARSDGEEAEVVADPAAPLCARVFKVRHESHVGELAFFRVFSGTIRSSSECYNATRDHAERVGQLLVSVGRNRSEVDEIGPGCFGAVAKLRDTRHMDTLCDARRKVVFPPVEYGEPVISVALVPETKKDQERISQALAQLCAEDPTLRLRVDQEFSQTVLEGMGETQLDVAVAQLRERFGVSVKTEPTRVPYRETIRKKVEAQGKYKRQSGGRGQYGDCWLRLEPLPRGAGFEFVDAIVGGVIPSKYIPAVQKGVEEAMRKGVYAGYPVVDVRVTVYDGSYHEVDSSDMAFSIAGSMALKKAVMMADPVIIEPYVEVEVSVPEDCVGDITGDINSRRGRILGIEPRGKMQVVKAVVPLAEMGRYSTDLKSMTQGRGSHTMKFSHYEEAPAKICEELAAAFRASQQEEN